MWSHGWLPKKEANIEAAATNDDAKENLKNWKTISRFLHAPRRKDPENFCAKYFWCCHTIEKLQVWNTGNVKIMWTSVRYLLRVQASRALVVNVVVHMNNLSTTKKITRERMLESPWETIESFFGAHRGSKKTSATNCFSFNHAMTECFCCFS